MPNQYKQDYDKRKELVLSYLERAIQQLRSWNNSEAADNLEKLKNNVAQGLFSIVLVGEFSRGKSTFLNALMHKRILPSFSGEATATVNFLRHINQAPDGVAGRVYYRDGTTNDLLSLDRNTLEKVVSTKGNNGDTTIAATVDHVDLYLDSAFLENGVMLVDSPGLNSMMEGHQELTERQIRQSHACIFMFSAGQPGNKSEFETLRQLRQNSNNFFFVLNKIGTINLLEGDTVESVTEELKSRYQKQFPDAQEIPKIWPIDSYDALLARDPDEDPIKYQNREEYERKSRFSAFENRLWQYLTQGERARDQLKQPVDVALGIIGAERRQRHKELDLLQNQQSSDHLLQQKAFLEKEIESHKSDPQIDFSNLSRQVQNIVEELTDSLPRHKDDLMNLARDQFARCETPEDLQQTLQHFNPLLKRKLEKLGKRLDDKLKSELLEILNTEYTQFFTELEEQLDQRFDGSAFIFEHEPLQTFDGSVHVDLKGMLEKQNALEAEIEKLENEQTNVELRKIQVRKIEHAIAEKKNELKDLKKSFQYIQANFQAPSIEYHPEEKDDEIDRGGVLGFVADFLFGKKKVNRWHNVADSSTRDDAVKRHEAYLTSINADIIETEKSLNSIDKPTESSDDLEFKYSQLQRKIDKAHTRLQQLLDDDISLIQKKAALAISQHRDEILGSLDEMLTTFIENAETHLKSQKRSYCSVVRESLESKLNMALQAQKNQLDEVIRNLNLEEAERNSKCKELRIACQAADTLLEEGANLSGMLDTEMADKIEMDVFSTHPSGEEVFV